MGSHSHLTRCACNMALRRLRTTKNCNKMRTMDCNRNNRNSARSKQSLIRALGPNVSKAGELEEEESAGTALMPHPRPAAFWPFKKPIRPQRCLRNQRRERRGQHSRPVPSTTISRVERRQRKIGLPQEQSSTDLAMMAAWRWPGDCAQVGSDGPRGPRDARGTYREQQREGVQRHSDTSHRARLSSNRFGNRYKADYVEDAGNRRSDDRYRSGNKNKAGNRRSGDRNKNKAGNVKATGQEQDSGHFTKRSARPLRSLRSRPRARSVRYEVRS